MKRKTANRLSGNSPRTRKRWISLVLDIIMPRKNGKDAYLEIRKIRPEIRALFMSGYTADFILSKGILETGLDLVLKPISPTDFLKKVREALDRK